MSNLTPNTDASVAPSVQTSPFAGREFATTEAALVLNSVVATRAILRAVALAVAAQEDGSVEYEDNESRRWQPAIDEACAKMRTVRDVLMETYSAPGLDWVTPLVLLEAIGASLWYGHAGTGAKTLDSHELGSVLQVAIEAADSFLLEFETKGSRLLDTQSKTIRPH